MAGFSKIYCVGGLGGFMGADGINPIFFQILVGDADRQWLEVKYFDKTIKPMGNITTIIPEGPNHPNSLLDACIAFFPKFFVECPSVEIVSKKLANKKRLDFDAKPDEIPKEWQQLRNEALTLFKTLHIFEAGLRKMKLDDIQ